jgi:hypothetical protein
MLFLGYLGELGALQRDVGHQALDVEDKGDDRVIQFDEKISV